MKRETKRRLQDLVRRVGHDLTTLESECYVQQFGMDHAKDARIALEMLTIQIAQQPET